MQCTACQQNNMVSVNGRYFCVDCGNRASQRLQNFQSETASSHESNVLNLNQNGKAASSNSGPPKSLHGMHAPSMPQPQPQAAPRQPHPSEPAPGRPSSAPESLPDAQPAGAPSPPPPQPSPANPAAAPPPPEPDPPQLDTTATASTTPMEPFQVYPLKSDSPGYNQVSLSSEQHLAESELPPVEQAEFDRSAGPDTKRTKPRGAPWLRLFDKTAVRVGVVSMCIVLLAGYVTYLNYPNIAVKVAASRANIDATMPEYTPGGYEFNGPVAYDQGRLTISFKNQREDATIAVTQSSTQWDSQSLLENYINYQTSRYETYRENGLTIYTYNNRNAAWVNGGTLYQIKSETFLSQNDIVKMASSM